MRAVGVAEVVVGLFVVIISSFLMLSSVLNSETDLHSYMLGVTIFGSGLGGLLAFAGAFLLTGFRFKVLAQLPFLLFSIVSWVVWSGAYA